MKVLVCGGRDFNDYKLVCNTLGLYVISEIIHGCAAGADSLAGDYACEMEIPATVYRADWKQHGKSAGPKRNRQMLDENPDVELVIAFAGGVGTKNMIDYAKTKGVTVREIR